MKLTIRRPNEPVGIFATLDVYVNGQVIGQVPPNGQMALDIPDERSEVFVKTSWCESNRIMIESDVQLKAFARGGLVGATFNSLFNPKKTYALEWE